jgi:hypothetical protein
MRRSPQHSGRPARALQRPGARHRGWQIPQRRAPRGAHGLHQLHGGLYLVRQGPHHHHLRVGAGGASGGGQGWACSTARAASSACSRRVRSSAVPVASTSVARVVCPARPSGLVNRCCVGGARWCRAPATRRAVPGAAARGPPQRAGGRGAGPGR